MKTEFAVSCTFYCLQFSVLCAFKSPSLLSSKEAWNDQECCQLQLHTKNFDSVHFCLDAQGDSWGRGGLRRHQCRVEDSAKTHFSAHFIYFKSNIQACCVLCSCFFWALFGREKNICKPRDIIMFFFQLMEQF